MSLFNFPNQRIPETEKDEEWHKSHIANYLSYAQTGDYELKKKEIAKMYYAYSAMVDKEDEQKICKTITERYGNNLGPKYVVYPLCESNVENLIGQYRLRPLKRKLMVNNPDAVIKKLDKKNALVAEKIIRELNEDVQANLGFKPESENQDIQIPENIETWFEKDYRTNSEEQAEDVLYQLLIVNKEKEKVYNLLRHYLIAGRVHGIADEKDGHPSILIPHPLDCFYDVDPQEPLQKDPFYFVWDKYMTINETLNTFDGLKEADIKKIESYSDIDRNTNPTESASNSNWFLSERGSSFRLRTVSMMWKSRKKVKFITFENKKTGKEESKILKDDDKPRNRDNVKTIEIDDIRHITMIGPDVVLSYGSLDEQMKKQSNPKKRFLPISGLVSENSVGTGEIRSLVKKLMDLQDFASEILYEIRLAARQMDGSVMVYDLANIPKEWAQYGEKAIDKVNFHLKRDRIQYINSRDKRANPYASSVNVSQKGRIDELMNLLALIEELAEKITGINDQVKGQGKSYEKATVAEMQYTASTARTEEYFGQFDTFLESLLDKLILKGQQIYKEGDVFSFFGGDNQQKFLKIAPDFLQEDIGCHIADNRKEYEKSKGVEQLATEAFRTAGDPELLLELLKLYNADGSSEKEAIFKKGIKSLVALREENARRAEEIEKAKLQDKAEERAQKDRLADKTADKDITVAKIYADNKADDTNTKEAGQNLRKIADIEKEILLNQNKN